MQFAAIFAAAVFAFSAAADKHTFCNCYVNDQLDATLSESACNQWAADGYPHTEWTVWANQQPACYDYYQGGGIDGDRWTSYCQKMSTGEATDDVNGHCFGLF
ncbi:hypothetical protein GGR50DRAFT_138451 [Xylaria sp. CBS 124048]|nr:hypothetical protein GGR50DRAFT_138451 [Xylaria sp. CBS 124048]